MALGLFAPTGRYEAGANDNIGDSMNNVGRFALFGASALVISCAAGSQPSYSQYGSTRYVIKGAELVARDFAGMNAYDAIQRMRPSWLMDRRVSDSPGDNRRALMVFIDSVLEGGLEVLEYRTFGDIYELRYHIAPEATKRWGYRYAGGVIEIITKKKSPRAGVLKPPRANLSERRTRREDALN